MTNYSKFTPDRTARERIIVVEGEGALAVMSMADLTPMGFFSCAKILYKPTKPERFSDCLLKLSATEYHLPLTSEELLSRLERILNQASMRTHLYVAARGTTLACVLQAASTHGMDEEAIHVEQLGPPTRRVRCIHCKCYLEEVTAESVKCNQCGTTLLVRDHYSRRHAAFMGVCNDAETVNP